MMICQRMKLTLKCLTSLISPTFLRVSHLSFIDLIYDPYSCIYSRYVNIEHMYIQHFASTLGTVQIYIGDRHYTISNNQPIPNLYTTINHLVSHRQYGGLSGRQLKLTLLQDLLHGLPVRHLSIAAREAPPRVELQGRGPSGPRVVPPGLRRHL